MWMRKKNKQLPASKYYAKLQNNRGVDQWKRRNEKHILILKNEDMTHSHQSGILDKISIV